MKYIFYTVYFSHNFWTQQLMKIWYMKTEKSCLVEKVKHGMELQAEWHSTREDNGICSREVDLCGYIEDGVDTLTKYAETRGVEDIIFGTGVGKLVMEG